MDKLPTHLTQYGQVACPSNSIGNKYKRSCISHRVQNIKISFYGWKEELISSINNENVNINTGKIISHFPHNVHNSYILWVWVNVTFNNISAILLWSVLLVEKTIV
jgi:hypothetical protein